MFVRLLCLDHAGTPTGRSERTARHPLHPQPSVPQQPKAEGSCTRSASTSTARFVDLQVPIVVGCTHTAHARGPDAWCTRLHCAPSLRRHAGCTAATRRCAVRARMRLQQVHCGGVPDVVSHAGHDEHTHEDGCARLGGAMARRTSPFRGRSARSVSVPFPHYTRMASKN